MFRRTVLLLAIAPASLALLGVLDACGSFGESAPPAAMREGGATTVTDGDVQADGALPDGDAGTSDSGRTCVQLPAFIADFNAGLGTMTPSSSNGNVNIAQDELVAQVISDGQAHAYVSHSIGVDAGVDEIDLRFTLAATAPPTNTGGRLGCALELSETAGGPVTKRFSFSVSTIVIARTRLLAEPQPFSSIDLGNTTGAEPRTYHLRLRLDSAGAVSGDVSVGSVVDAGVTASMDGVARIRGVKLLCGIPQFTAAPDAAPYDYSVRVDGVELRLCESR